MTQRAGPRVSAVVLAAGASTRMGGVDKLMETVDGVPVVTRVVDAAAGGGAHEVVVVTGPDHDDLAGALQGRPVRIAPNPEPSRGMGSSLAVGAEAADPAADALLVCLGDMPRLTSGHVTALVDAFDPGAGRAVCVPVHQGRRGHPVLFDAAFRAELASLGGDRGARALLERHAEVVHEVPVDDDGVLFDVDTPEALREARSGASASVPPSSPGEP